MRHTQDLKAARPNSGSVHVLHCVEDVRFKIVMCCRRLDSWSVARVTGHQVHWEIGLEIGDVFVIHLMGALEQRVCSRPTASSRPCFLLLSMILKF